MTDELKILGDLAAGPAPLTNKFLVNGSSEVFRFAFFEAFNNENPQLRAIVCMPRAEAVSLRDLLTRLLEPVPYAKPN